MFDCDFNFCKYHNNLNNTCGLEGAEKECAYQGALERIEWLELQEDMRIEAEYEEDI